MKRKIVLLMTLTLLVGVISIEKVYAKSNMSLIDLEKHWANTTVGKLVEYGVIDGYSDGTFKPNNTITRAEFTKLIRNSLKLEIVEGNSFEDTSKHWAKNEIHTVVINGGIVKSEYGNALDPNKDITRIEMAKIIVRSLGLDKQAKEKARQNTGFNDDSSIPSTDKGYIIIANENKIIQGYPNKTFQPNGKATRAEASQMIINMLEAITREEEPKEEPKEEDVVKRVNKTLETRKTNIQLQKGVKSAARYENPKTYEELKENIESLKESDFSVKKKSDWEFIAVDQFVSNSADHYYSGSVKGAVKMELPNGSKLSTVDFEGETYATFINNKLSDNKFHHGFLIKDGEILQQITRVGNYYSLGEMEDNYIHKADYISFVQYGYKISPNYDGLILYVFENPFKK